VDEQALTDEQLIAYVARDESWALAEIYDRYARLVFSLAVKTLNDRSGAEEIVQEVFAKVWRGASAFDPARGKFSSWLIGIAHHQCIDELRRRRVRPISEAENESTMSQQDSDDPAEAAAHSLERARVLRALEQIPPEQRRVIEAAYLEGLTHQEIADRFKQPLGTVKTRLRLGMQKLKELLKE
jgi:RNA polymerase sigma-70 factor (ECF subfamily)